MGPAWRFPIWGKNLVLYVDNVPNRDYPAYSLTLGNTVGWILFVF